LTLELLFSLGLAAVAFGSFLAYYQSVRQQQTDLKHFADGTFLLQSTMEEIRAGKFGAALDGLAWTESEGAGAERWHTPVQAAGVFTWRIAAETKPVRREIFPFKVVVTWDERGRKRAISAATEVTIQ
jgi:hypothetical protein